MQGARQPIILIYTRPRRTVFYPSVREASRDSGISIWRILRGLEDPDGEIPNTRPRVYVDEALTDNTDREDI